MITRPGSPCSIATEDLQAYCAQLVRCPLRHHARSFGGLLIDASDHLRGRRKNSRILAAAVPSLTVMIRTSVAAGQTRLPTARTACSASGDPFPPIIIRGGVSLLFSTRGLTTRTEAEIVIGRTAAIEIVAGWLNPEKAS